MSDSAAIEKKIEELEAEMARTQKNKATNYRKLFSLLRVSQMMIHPNHPAHPPIHSRFFGQTWER